MIKSVEAYLARLEQELAGGDPETRANPDVRWEELLLSAPLRPFFGGTRGIRGAAFTPARKGITCLRSPGGAARGVLRPS